MYQISSLQQNLNQIVQICSQLSQNEQSNISRLTQMQQAERTAAQQLQHCAQLCHQVSQQVQQMMSSSQVSRVGQQGYVSPSISTFSGITPTTGGLQSPIQTSGFQSSASMSGTPTGHWANRPINTGQFTSSGQFGMTGQYGGTDPSLG